MKRLQRFQVLFLFFTVKLPNEMFPSILQSSINAGAFAMLGGMIIVPVVSLLTPKLDRELVDSCFSWYEEPVTVAAKFSLSDKE